nr:MAG TPA: hypothetical protein [Caudoviricetes sp.]
MCSFTALIYTLHVDRFAYHKTRRYVPVSNWRYRKCI